MVKTLFRLSLCGILVSALPVGAAPAHDAGHLNWPGKAAADAPRYGVPPSPYGNVGDFFKKELTWPTKPAPQTAPVIPAPVTPSAVPAPPVESAPQPVADTRALRPERYVGAPTEPYTYRPATYSPIPQVASRVAPPVPVASLTTPPPLPAPAPRLTHEQVRALEASPAPVAAPTATTAPARRAVVKPVPKPVTMAPIPNPAAPVAEARPAPATPVPAPVAATKPATPPPPAVATAPAPSAPTAAPDLDAYQIPRSSKYYRGPQTDTAPQSPPGTAAGVGFTPGQTVTDPATQSPRFYSLHREYGLSPDTIQQTQEPGQNDLPVAQTK